MKENEIMNLIGRKEGTWDKVDRKKMLNRVLLTTHFKEAFFLKLNSTFSIFKERE